MLMEKKSSIGKLILELRSTFPHEASPRLPGYCWYIICINDEYVIYNDLPNDHSQPVLTLYLNMVSHNLERQTVWMSCAHAASFEDRIASPN